MVADVLQLTESIRSEMVIHALEGLPFEACGLLVGDPQTGAVERFVPTENEAASARVYTIPGVALLRAERDAEDDGLAVIGVMHSHTHTEAYPSPTDVKQAPDPQWHYVIVSLRTGGTALRSYRIVEGDVEEESVELRDE